MNNFVSVVVEDFHVEGPHRATTVPGATIARFSCIIHFLAHTVFDCESVLGFEADENWQQKYTTMSPLLNVNFGPAAYYSR